MAAPLDAVLAGEGDRLAVRRQQVQLALRPARRRRRSGRATTSCGADALGEQVEAGRAVERIHQRLRSTPRRRRAACATQSAPTAKKRLATATPKRPSSSRARIDHVIAAPRATAALRQQSLEQARDVDRLALRAVGDLVAAAGAVGDDDRVGLLAHGRQQARFGHLHRDVVVARPRSRSCRPCRSTSSRSAPAWRRGSGAARRGSARPRRTPSGGSGRAPGSARRPACRSSAKRPALASRAMNSSNSSACLATISARVAEAHHQRLVAQRQQARRLEADDGDAGLAPAAAARRSARRRVALASSTMPLAR